MVSKVNKLTDILYERIVTGNEDPIFEMETEKGGVYKQVNPMWSLFKDFMKLQTETLTNLGMNVWGRGKAGVPDSGGLSEGERLYLELSANIANNHEDENWED